MRRILIIILILISFTSCQKNNEVKPAKTDTLSDKITIGMFQVDDLNPLALKSSYNEQANFLMYDGLYMINNKFDAEPNLVKDLVIENNGLTVNLTIKRDIKFHDGSPLTAYDVEATINYILLNGGYYKYNIRNIASVSVTSDYSMNINLSYYTPNIKMQLTFPIVCKKELLNATNFNINGTGAYKLSSETRGKQMTLMLYEGYHSQIKTKIKEIEISFIPDKSTTRSLSGSGILDVFYSSFYDEGLKTITKSQTTKFDYATDEYTFISVNYDNPLLNIKAVRKAIGLGINREKLRDDVYMSHADVAFLPIPPNAWGYNGNNTTQNDAVLAKKLLNESGFSDVDNNSILEMYENETKKELRFSILSIDTPIKRSLCNALATSLKEIGVSLEVSYQDKENFNIKLQEKKYDLYLITTNIGYDLDFYEFLDPKGKFSTPIDFNFDEQQRKIAYTDKRELKQPVYMRLCDDFHDNMPHIPLLFLKNTLITSNKISETKDIYPNNLYYKILRSE
jgi:peptide/nickel transport system substrate-binding protein